MEATDDDSYEARHAREIAERRERQTALDALARAIAGELPGTWTVFADREEPPYRPETTLTRRADGAYLSLEENDKAQLSVRGGPSNALHAFAFGYGHPPCPGANIAVTKGYKKIAQEIARRVLPGLDKLIAHAVERKAQHDAHEATTKGLADQLLTAAAGHLTTGNRDSGGTRVLHTHGLKCYGTIHVTGDSARIELGSVGPEAALAIARLLVTPPKDEDE